MKYIDQLLNSITMYRVVMYGLLFLSLMAIAFGFMNILNFTGLVLLASFVFLVVVCLIVNTLLSFIFKASMNLESWLITALILFLILPPATNLNGYIVLAAAGAISMISKFVFAIKKKHLFNPAAIGIFILALAGIGSANWWVGSYYLLVPTLVVGFLIVRKIRRFSLFFAFIVTALLTILFTRVSADIQPLELVGEVLSSWPIIFFATVMLTEPQTAPPTRNLQILYGIIVGLIFGSKFSFGPIYPTPEFALVVGNLFSYIVSPKQKLFLKLKEKVQVAKDTYEFIFISDKKLDFKPGQYIEWTLDMTDFDSRGNRRYFTIASSPTEEDIRLGIRLSPQSSKFKERLMDLEINDKIVASQLSGDFTPSNDPKEKMVFIAGGIGVTPFRSIIKYMVDKQDERDVVMFYANNFEEDIAYRNLFDEAASKLNLKNVYVLTEKLHAPKDWKGEVGFLNEDVVKKHVPDYKERKFYLSGPQAMVVAYKKLLMSMGVSQFSIVTDYFPGF